MAITSEMLNATIGESEKLVNECEQRFLELASSKGWVASKRGWPDFFVFNPEDESEMFAVEVKPRVKSGRFQKPTRFQIRGGASKHISW